jgi:hypothetical protein
MSMPAATAGAVRARAAHAEAVPLRLPPAPRRVSGPSRHPRAAPARPAAAPSLVVRVIDHPWLERLVRGRAWIAIVATALLGIVAMQVAQLRLGAEIGSETTAVNALTAQNETTRTEIAVMEASHRLSTTAGDLGMVYPAPDAVTYLAVNPGDAARAVHEMTVPSDAAIAAAAADTHRLGSSSAAANVTAPATTTPSTTTPSTTTPATTTPATTTIAATTPGGAATGATSTTSAGTPASTNGTTAAAATSGTAGTTTASTGTAGSGTASTGTASSGTAGSGTAGAGTTAPATTTSGAATAPATTAAGGTTPGG